MAQEFMTIAEQIAAGIKNGTYTDTLPSIARLSEQFDVCPATVKRILSQLRDWDLVSGEHGRCVRINPKAAGNLYFHKNVVLLADLSTIATPFFAKTLEQLTDALNGCNMSVHVFLSENQIQECVFTPDCAVTVNKNSLMMEEMLLSRFPACPAVRLNQPSSRFPFVISDGRKAGYEAIRHLAEDCGHTHIGVLATQLQYPRASFRQRYDGAMEYVRKHPEICLSMAEIPERDMQSGFRMTGELFKADPAISAVFATCDMFALGVYCYAAEHQLKIPDDLAVIGFDNEEFSQTLVPGLTTFSENAPDSAECLFHIICDLLMGRKAGNDHLTDPLLLVRGSTCKHREDPN